MLSVTETTIEVGEQLMILLAVAFHNSDMVELKHRENNWADTD